MKKDDLINALKVMRTILKDAKLAYEPADKMIDYLQKNSLYTDNDIEEAFLGRYMCNSNRTTADIMEVNYFELFNTFKSSAFLDRFGNSLTTQ